MNISQFTEEDGYYEAIASFDGGWPGNKNIPIFRVRCVRNGKGLFDEVIRHYSGRGVMLKSQTSENPSLQFSQVKAIKLLLSFLKEQGTAAETTVTRARGITRKFVPGTVSLEHM